MTALKQKTWARIKNLQLIMIKIGDRLAFVYYGYLYYYTIYGLHTHDRPEYYFADEAHTKKAEFPYLATLLTHSINLFSDRRAIQELKSKYEVVRIDPNKISYNWNRTCPWFKILKEK